MLLTFLKSYMIIRNYLLIHIVKLHNLTCHFLDFLLCTCHDTRPGPSVSRRFFGAAASIGGHAMCSSIRGSQDTASQVHRFTGIQGLLHLGVSVLTDRRPSETRWADLPHRCEIVVPHHFGLENAGTEKLVESGEQANIQRDII